MFDAGEFGDVAFPGSEIALLELVEVIVSAGSGHDLHELDGTFEIGR